MKSEMMVPIVASDFGTPASLHALLIISTVAGLPVVAIDSAMLVRITHIAHTRRGLGWLAALGSLGAALAFTGAAAFFSVTLAISAACAASAAFSAALALGL